MSTNAPLPTTPVDVFGPLVTRSDVADAVLKQLQSETSGLLFYIAERERRLGLPARQLPVPPSSASFRGGLDFETYGNDEFPLVIVVTQPNGPPERSGGGEYEQTFDVSVGALVQAQSEPEAILLADQYGISMAACVLQHGSLGGIATKSLLSTYPETRFPNPDRRSTVLSVVVLSVYIQPVFAERFGPWPAQDQPDPYRPPGDYPIVTEVDLTLEADSLPAATPETSSSETVEIDPDYVFKSSTRRP